MQDEPRNTELFCPVCHGTQPAEMKDGWVKVVCTTCGSEYLLDLRVKIMKEYGTLG